MFNLFCTRKISQPGLYTRYKFPSFSIIIIIINIIISR